MGMDHRIDRNMIGRIASIGGKKGVAGIGEKKVARSRSGSCGSMEKIWKRKWEGQEEGGKRKEGEVFKASKKTVRSPDIMRGEKKGMIEMMKRLLRENRKEREED